MGLKVILRGLVGVMFACALTAQSLAQTQYETPYHDFKATYNAEVEYSIIYDNEAAFAKLREFRLKFYDSTGRLLLETDTEVYPATVKAKTYNLSAPVMGFNVIELSITSLHSGDERDFPENIRGVLGLTLAEAKVEVESEVDPGPVNPVRTLTAAEKARLDSAASAIEANLKSLASKTLPLESITDARLDNIGRISQLLDQTKDLSDAAKNEDPQGLFPQINTLTDTLTTAKNDAENNTEIADKQSELETLKSELINLRNQIDELVSASGINGADSPDIMLRLESLETQSADITDRLSEIELPNQNMDSEIEAWAASYAALNTQYYTPPEPMFRWPVLLAALLIGLAGVGLGAKLWLSQKTQMRPPKSILQKSENVGVVFPASPMLAGNVATPLAPAGKLAAAQLQMLTGPYAVLREAYQATGRIGYAQDGVPTAEDYSFGTGFLISDRHVVTNRHVHGLYGHYLLDKTDPGGIEFIAEKDKDASDFAAFNGEPPLLLPALDIAIYTLAQPVAHRAPIALQSVETEALDGRNIVVIGYPDTHTPDSEEIKAVVEENAVFAVKRLSQGQIFRHSTDTDTPFGVATQVSKDKHTSFTMPAICHNASTLGGNSGSPLLDVKTGQLVGVHFAGFKVFNREEAANLAMAIAQLTEAGFEKDMQA